MIRFDNVSMGYERDCDILQDINLTLKPGSFHFVTGGSGAGKSSFLRLLLLLHKPSHGQLHLFGRNVAELDRDDIADMRTRIGMVFQDYRLVDHLSVAENIALPLKVRGEAKSAIMDKVRELLGWVDMLPLHDALPATLSGGQKQRVAIARAVIGKPDILLADEPTGNLDPGLSIKFMYLFEQLYKSGTTIVFATHDNSLLAQFRYPVLRIQNRNISYARKRIETAPQLAEQFVLTG